MSDLRKLVGVKGFSIRTKEKEGWRDFVLYSVSLTQEQVIELTEALVGLSQVEKGAMLDINVGKKGQQIYDSAFIVAREKLEFRDAEAKKSFKKSGPSTADQIAQLKQKMIKTTNA